MVPVNRLSLWIVVHVQTVAQYLEKFQILHLESVVHVENYSLWMLLNVYLVACHSLGLMRSNQLLM